MKGDGSVYTLAKADKGVGFYQVEQNAEVPQGKAYAISNSGIGYYPLTDDPTGISHPLAPAPSAGQAVYNLSGQRLSRPLKGLNIISDKKVAIR